MAKEDGTLFLRMGVVGRGWGTSSEYRLVCVRGLPHFPPARLAEHRTPTEKPGLDIKTKAHGPGTQVPTQQ